MTSAKAAKANPKKTSGSPKGKTFEVTPEGVAEAVGSTSEAFQITAISQALEALWQPARKPEETRERELQATYDALRSIAPRSELEGMLAVQMLSVHNAAMECMRRAMLEQQTFEGRDQNLKHAAKLMSLYERQLAALDRHRGKGQQKITVEHVTVEAGGQAIVGDVSLAKDNTIPGGNRQLGDEGAGSIEPSGDQARVRQAAGRRR
ncbi:hypothetical protein [Tsuneonella sp. SYSU-LHT278]|uniref:hypothetical protein n=1 Tax=Tsuneonella sediminis TaxID=3416089 RepID=UPI003F7AFD1B